MNSLELFMYTVEEYKRFSIGLWNSRLTDTYTEKEYVETNVKLMILRKYGSNSKNNNVYIGTIIKDAIGQYPNKKCELDKILDNYNDIEKEQMEYFLSDGTRLNLYEIIEDTMYGIYLHADEDRIKRLKKSNENLRFICIRKYVEDFEKVVLRLYDCLKDLMEEKEPKEVSERASVIHLGSSNDNAQNIKKSQYWSNLYGRDGNDNDIDEIIEKYNIEDCEIILKSNFFLQELKKDVRSIELLDSLIDLSTKSAWGDYSDAYLLYKSLNKPGLSTMVRYNDGHTIAKIRIFENVEETFIIEEEHIVSGLYEIVFHQDKENNEWKIYYMGKQKESDKIDDIV